MYPAHDPAIVEKPRGHEIRWAHTDRHAGKVLEVDAGHRLSLQKHEGKRETPYLQSSHVCFTCDDEAFDWPPGPAIATPPGTVHRTEAVEDSVILKVSTPELDDVVRLEDDCDRD